jgi:hypothetical protein
MSSSTHNDSYIVQQFEQLFHSNTQRYRFLNHNRGIHKTIKQKNGVNRLSNEQMHNLLGNYLRMKLFFSDNNESARRAGAVEYEQVIADRLQKKQIEYVPEHVLQQENKIRQRRHQQALPTPDFLFKKPEQFVLNGKVVEVNWIECKSYYASTIPRLKTILGFEQTANKYYKAYGKGIMVFKHGFNKDLNVPDGVYYKRYKEKQIIL